MKLSEAMILGSTTCRMVAGDWNSCAIGAAGNAVGLAAAYEPSRRLLIPAPNETSERYHRLIRLWPWLEVEATFNLDVGSYCQIITSQFDELVCSDEMTLDQLADYVRSVEPSCGDCNRSECTCVGQNAPAEIFAEVLA